LEIDEAGQYLARDILGAVYGLGPTPEAAVADFYDLLDSHIRFLRENRDRLDPVLLQQLTLLQRLFGQ
jgi:hypothetical protein